MELKVDNMRARIDEVKAEVQELKTKNKEFKTYNQIIIKMIEQAAQRNGIQHKSTLRYLHATICSIVHVPEVPPELEHPLTEHRPEVRVIV